MVRDVFRLAKENSPSIIFIDEIDAIATKRFDAQTGADREVQRILLELLNQMDGFDQTTNVKVRGKNAKKHIITHTNQQQLITAVHTFILLDKVEVWFLTVLNINIFNVYLPNISSFV